MRQAAHIKIRSQPIRRPKRLSDKVVEALRKDVESGRVSPGDRLPSEMELTATFGVSRTVIREAISRLQADGLVKSRQGSGVFITSPDDINRPFRLKADNIERLGTIREIFELRIGVESEAAALAAQRRNRSDLADLRKDLKTLLATEGGSEAAVLADLQFHRKIAEISRNSQIMHFLEYLSAVLIESIRTARQNSAKRTALADQAEREHMEIFASIDAGDADRAREAVRTHLTNAQERLALA